MSMYDSNSVDYDMVNDTLSSGPPSPTKHRVLACAACHKGHKRCDTRDVCTECRRTGSHCIRVKSQTTPHRAVSPMHVSLKHHTRQQGVHVVLDNTEATYEAAHALVLLAKRYCIEPQKA